MAIIKRKTGNNSAGEDIEELELLCKTRGIYSGPAALEMV